MASADAIAKLRHPTDTPGPGTGTIPATLRALVPNHPACTEALRIAEHWLPAAILNHSFRVFLYAHAFLNSPNGDPPLAPPEPTSASDSPEPISQKHHHQQQQHSSPQPKPPPQKHHLDLRTPTLFVTTILHDIGTTPVFDPTPSRFEVCAADTVAAVLRTYPTNFPPALVREAWLAVALHTSPGIAEALGGMARAVRLAVRADFGTAEKPAAGVGALLGLRGRGVPPREGLRVLSGRDAGGVGGGSACGEQEEDDEFGEGRGREGAGTGLGEDVVGWVERELPRLEVERVLGARVVDGAMGDGELEGVKAPGGSWPGDLVRAKREAPGWEGVNRAF